MSDLRQQVKALGLAGELQKEEVEWGLAMEGRERAWEGVLLLLGNEVTVASLIG
jgi:hypothetical protein